LTAFLATPESFKPIIGTHNSIVRSRIVEVLLV